MSGMLSYNITVYCSDTQSTAYNVVHGTDSLIIINHLSYYVIMTILLCLVRHFIILVALFF